MDFNPRVIPSLKVESFNYNIHDTETIDLTQSSSNDEVIDLTGSFNNDEIIDLTQTSSDESTTHFSTSSNDEMDTSPDDDDDYIPPAIHWPARVQHVTYDRTFQSRNRRLNHIAKHSNYFTNCLLFDRSYNQELNAALKISGKKSFRSTGFLMCIRKIVSLQKSETDAFDPDLLKFTNTNRNDYLADLKINANLSNNVHNILSVKVCTWFASVESIHLTRSSFTFLDGPSKVSFLKCDPFHKWLHAQTDTL